MKARKYIELTAIFLIFLILTLPICIASELNVYSIGGTNHNVDGFVTGPDDNLKIVVDAKLDSGTVTKNDVKLGNKTFDSCTSSPRMTGGQTCTKTLILSALEITTENNWPITMNDGENIIYPEGQTTTIVDSIAPDIIFSISPSASSPSSEITISYTIQDYAYSRDDNLKCAGIKKLEFFNNFTGVKFKSLTSEVATNPNECYKEGSFTILASGISFSEGTFSVEAKAYDNFNHIGSAFADLVIDSTPPSIDVNSFMFVNSLGNKIEFIGMSGTTANATVNITSNDLNVSSVMADFGSDLNPDNPIGVVYATACNLIDGNYTCEWDNLALNPAVSFEGSISITASDIYGNTRTQNIPYTINLDNTEPIIDSIESNHKAGTQSYIGAERNDIIVKLDDAGAGFNERKVWLNFDSQGDKQADNCTKTGAFWYCYWYNVVTDKESGTTITAVIEPSSSDDAGNILVGTKTADFIVDKISPIIVSIVSSPDALTSDDTLTITAKIIEMNNASIAINASGISSSNSLFTETCTTDTLEKTCIVEIDDIVSTYLTLPLNITVYDVAGNKAETSKDITVYELLDTGTPNFYKIDSISTIPSNIDKGIISKIAMNIFVSPSISMIAPTTAVIASENVECPLTSYTDFNQQPYIMNSGINPIIVIKTTKIETYSILNDSLPVNCVLKLKIRNGNKVYKSFETENITVNIPLLGILPGIDEAAQKKIDGITDEITALEKEIADKEKIISTYGTFCSIAKMLGQINSLLQTIKSILWGVSMVMFHIPWLTHAATTLWNAICRPTTTFHNIVENIIWPSGFMPTGANTIGLMIKVACMVSFECALCNADAWGSVASSIIMVKMAESASKGTMGNKIPTLSDPSLPDGTYTINVATTLPDGTVIPAGTTITKSGGSYTYGTNPTTPPAPIDLSSIPINTFSGDSYSTSTALPSIPATPPPAPAVAKELTWQENIKADPSAAARTKWQDTGVIATAPGPGDSANWIWNPYKSIHYAKSCMCIPAEAYNLKKDVQIKCMYRNCITDLMIKGLPITPCTEMYKERECLYVEGAEYKRGMNVLDIFSSIFTALLSNYGFIIAGIAYLVGCLDYVLPTGQAYCALPPAGGRSAGCGVWGALNTINEIISLKNIAKFSAEEYSQELGGIDYCTDFSQY